MDCSALTVAAHGEIGGENPPPLPMPAPLPAPPFSLPMARVGGKTWWQWVLLGSTAGDFGAIPRSAITSLRRVGPLSTRGNPM